PPTAPAAGWRELWRRLTALASPTSVRDERRRALYAWQQRMPPNTDPDIYRLKILAPIEAEIAQHEARSADAGQIQCSVRRAVQAYLDAECNRAVEERVRPRSYLADAQVPAREGDFHDRIDDIERVTQELASSARVLLTLQGRPGIGKTAMVTELRTRL